MKKIYIILILIIYLLGVVSIAYAARYDWSFGQPVITEDNDNTKDGARFDWVLGQPTIVREAPIVVDGADNFNDTQQIKGLEKLKGLIQVK